VRDRTDGWGADVVFECSGHARAAAGVFDPLCPGGRVVLIGIPLEPVPFETAAAMVKEATIETVFRYAHVYPRVLALMASGQLNVKPLITHRFDFQQSVRAFEWAAQMPADAVKAQIEMPQ
jgi:D-xylulose reductase